MANEVLCTPYIGRTIKGWNVRVRLCFSVTDATLGTAGFGDTFTANNTAVASLISACSTVTFYPLNGTSPIKENTYSGVSGDYDNAEDEAVLIFATLTGGQAKVTIPSPLDSIFLADKMTVDPANANVSALVSHLLGGGGALTSVTKTGAVYATFLGGLRKRAPTRRRLNIWVRNPELTAPGI